MLDFPIFKKKLFENDECRCSLTFVFVKNVRKKISFGCMREECYLDFFRAIVVVGIFAPSMVYCDLNGFFSKKESAFFSFRQIHCVYD